jgi:hypothetical protein
MAYPPKMYSVQSIAEICDGASKKVERQPLEGDRVQQFRLARIFHPANNINNCGSGFLAAIQIPLHSTAHGKA